MTSDRYVIGVDYGTLSGRALVVRVCDGAELGPAVHDYSHGVLDRQLARPVSRSAPAGPCRYPRTTSTSCARRTESRCGEWRRPSEVVGIATDFTACTVLPTLADGTPLCELAELAVTTARVREALEAPRGPGPGRPDQRPRPERGEPWLPRYGGRLSCRVAARERPAAPRGGPRDLRAYGPLDRGRRLDRVAAVRASSAKRLHSWLQGGPPGRRLSEHGLPPRAHPVSTSFFTEKLVPPAGPLGGRAGGLTEQAAAWTGLVAGTVVAVGNVDAHVTSPAAQRRPPARCSPSWARRRATS